MGRLSNLFAISKMIDSVQYWNFAKLIRIDPFQARNIESKLLRIRPSLVMSVNSANGTKIVFGGHGVELIEG